jgi:hypothetical protein
VCQINKTNTRLGLQLTSIKLTSPSNFFTESSWRTRACPPDLQLTSMKLTSPSLGLAPLVYS